MSASYKNIARVIKTQGRHGEVIVAALRGLPFLLEEGMEVCLTPPALDRPRWIRVEDGELLDDTQARVRFEGIDSMDLAESLCGCTVLVRVDDIELGDHDVAYDDLIGREVRDEDHGPLGTIVEVMETPANDVWVIDGSSYGEILIPVIEQVVGAVPEDGPIKVKLLDGLLDL